MLCCISFCISHPTLARSPFGQIPPHTHTRLRPEGKYPYHRNSGCHWVWLMRPASPRRTGVVEVMQNDVGCRS
ncbi:hypothetical protein PF010_g15104 [Phytophthora fragariae]|uniref:Uncharacterized protein n=1 Tax=Phytophthora fragariae TaxID=53985 RepID=A0A6G0NZ17_9STRA|nr:hypothetical protein PF010_g15104 [Phytophthora fragariae]KAE9228480.1 hypothetical protein PF004_g11063 [Phytophthora fragariae]